MGATTLAFYLVHYGQRWYLWGPNGAWPYDVFLEERPFGLKGASLYALSGSPMAFDLIYHLGIIVTFSFTVGKWPRLSGIGTVVFLYSIHARNEFILDGGDNCARIVLLFLVLTVTSQFLVLRMRPFGFDWKSPVSSNYHYVTAMFHNLGVALVVFQVCIIYLFAGLHKVDGPKWQDGTALYYNVQVDEFSYSEIARNILMSPFGTVFASYLVILFQLSFPFMVVFGGRWKFLSLALGVSFHIGILMSMHLTIFALYMMSVYPILVSDSEYGWLREQTMRILSRRRIFNRLRGSEAAESPNGGPSAEAV